MVDIVDKATRSRMMSGIRSKDTKPEMVIRRGLHARGFRYRLHVKDLPGRPDLVFPKYRAVIFVHGCFWHGHGCKIFKWPKTRAEFWREKIGGNRERDKKNCQTLQKQDWRIATLWECATRRNDNFDRCVPVEKISAWLESDVKTIELGGVW